jgi:hypothetical protein
LALRSPLRAARTVAVDAMPRSVIGGALKCMTIRSGRYVERRILQSEPSHRAARDDARGRAAGRRFGSIHKVTLQPRQGSGYGGIDKIAPPLPSMPGRTKERPKEESLLRAKSPIQSNRSRVQTRKMVRVLFPGGRTGLSTNEPSRFSRDFKLQALRRSPSPRRGRTVCVSDPPKLSIAWNSR